MRKTTLTDVFNEGPEADTDGKKAVGRKSSLFTEIIIDLSATNLDLIREITDSYQADGKIDQKFLYLDPISVNKWKKLIDCGAYKTYEHCKDALSHLLKSKFWKDKITNGNLTTIVDLGVGAGEKDNNILRSFIKLTNYEKSVTFVLIDTSFPMLETTLEQLRPIVDAHSKNVKVKAIRTDFLRLNRSESRFLSKSGSSAYFVLGCTFCNVDESSFMRSISKVAKKGDLLVVGVELFDEDNKESSLNAIKGTYDHEDLRELAIIPLKMILDREESKETLKRQIKIDVREHREFSEVNGAATVAISASLPDGTDVLLASSSRYCSSELVKFIGQYGFSFKESHASTANSFYKHFVFEYK